MLKLFVDDQETVFAASIYYHMVQWIPVTAIGMILFIRSGLSVADVEKSRDIQIDEDAMKESKS